LAGQSLVFTPSPFTTGGGNPDNQSPPPTHLASVGGNTGQLSYAYPLQLPPAATGFGPQLTLSYSSGSTNQRSSIVSPAGDVGEGFSLTLGSISAEEYTAQGAGGVATWSSLQII
jgi:hypothetical protein